jgi:hypothetical protein
MKSLRLLAVSMLTLGFLESGLSAATFTHLGVDCQFTSHDTVKRSSNGAVYNASTVGIPGVFCPLDSVASPQGITSASIVVVDNHPTDDVICTLKVHDAFGTIGYTSQKSTSGASNTAVTLSWAVPTPFRGDYGFIVCMIPRVAPSGMTSQVGNYNSTN